MFYFKMIDKIKEIFKHVDKKKRNLQTFNYKMEYENYTSNKIKEKHRKLHATKFARNSTLLKLN